MKLKIINCKICNKEFRTKSKDICYDCAYKNTFFDKNCIKCGKPFKGTRLQKQCEECRTNAHKNSTFKNTHTVTCICKTCGKIISKTTKVNCGKIKNDVICNDRNCKECKSKILSEHLKLKNPNKLSKQFNSIDDYNKSKIEQQVLKHKKILNENFELLEELRKIDPTADFKYEDPYIEKQSLLMRLNNPMFNDETKLQAKQTLKERIERGLIVISAKNRKTYTGCSRSIQNYLRIELSKWKHKLLTEHNYTCELCGKTGGDLHIHHTTPFREILKMICDELNLKYEDLKQIKHLDENYCKIKEKLLNYHYTHECGIVVCPSCHSKIDEHYHLEKKYENTEN